jgi:hypothetical protein
LFLKAKVPEELEQIVNPEFIMPEEGILYLKCLMALYGQIEVAHLLYDALDFS